MSVLKETLIGLCTVALIAKKTYAFVSVSAALAMNMKDVILMDVRF